MTGFRFFDVLIMASLFAAQVSPALNRYVAEGKNREPVAGLLSLPEIFGESGCPPLNWKRIDLFQRPSNGGPPAGYIELLNPPKQPPQPDLPESCETPIVVVRTPGERTAAEFPTEEKGYEIKAAVVYERSGRWFRIALEEGSAWIERENADGFMPYPAALASDEHLTYLRRGWDGRVWTEPGATAVPAQVPASWRPHLDREIPVRILAVQNAGAQSWIRVRLETEICGREFTGVQPFEGWLPAHRTTRETTVWFFSRGC